MNSEFPEVQKLLNLRAESQPSDEYVDEFLAEFHRRQREDLMKRSARSLFWERLTTWVREMGAAKWAYGAGVGYAMLMVGLFMWRGGGADEELLLPGNRVLEGAGQEKVLHFGSEEREAVAPSVPTEF